MTQAQRYKAALEEIARWPIVTYGQPPMVPVEHVYALREHAKEALAPKQKAGGSE